MRDPYQRKVLPAQTRGPALSRDCLQAGMLVRSLGQVRARFKGTVLCGAALCDIKPIAVLCRLRLGDAGPNLTAKGTLVPMGG